MGQGTRRRAAIASVAFAAAVTAAGCADLSGLTKSGAPTDAGSIDAPGSDSVAPDAGALPKHAPGGIALADTDAVCSELGGTVVITKAADESDVTSCALYYGASATTKLSLTPIARIPATGSDAQYEFIREGRPQAATHLLAFSVNAVGEMAMGVAMPLSELGEAVLTDLSDGQGAQSGLTPSAVIDATNGKLLVVTNDGANSGKPALYRCNLDGSACAYADISAGLGANVGDTPVIDTAAGALLVAIRNASNSNKLALFRCNLDGSACTYRTITANQGAGCGFSPVALIDEVNGKLLIVTDDGASSDTPALFHCNLDGSGCVYNDLSAGQGANSGISPSAVIDVPNGKLLVVTTNNANSGRPALFRCNLDGSGCAYSDISVGRGPNSGIDPSAAIDAATGKLLVVTTNNANSGRPALFRCNLDGSACTYSDISAGQGTDSGIHPSAVIDAASGKLLVVATNNANGAAAAALFRCNLDGTGCTYSEIAPGQGVKSGTSPSAILDPASHMLLVATQNDANNGKPALFDVYLR